MISANEKWASLVRDQHLFEHFAADTLVPVRSGFFPQLHALAEHDLQLSDSIRSIDQFQEVQAQAF